MLRKIEKVDPLEGNFLSDKHWIQTREKKLYQLHLKYQSLYSFNVYSLRAKSAKYFHLNFICSCIERFVISDGSGGGSGGAN